jgi:4-amino-4-deoxy-L-arabinose transferase-like glycosyltransferase
MTIQPVRSTRWQLAAIIVGLFLLALALRTTGIDWGGTHDDENPAAAAKVLTGQLTADQQYYPPLLNYLTAIGYALLYALGRAVGWWDSSAAFRDAYFVDKTPFLIVSRLVVATISATAAPLAALLALDHHLRRRDAIIVGVLVALMPGAIYWAHVAKSDSGLGPAYLLIVLTGFRLLSHIESRPRAIALGAALALAVSFKQSAIFFILPFALILAAAALWGSQRRPLTSVLRALSFTVVTAIALWIPLNIGIVLSPQGFIDAQVVQSQMSVRSAGAVVTAQEWFKSVTHAVSGLPAVALILWPLLVGAALVSIQTSVVRFRVTAMASATVIGMIIIATIAGTRQLPYLYLPYTTLITTAVAIAALSFSHVARPPVKIALAAALLLVAALFTIRATDILRQTLAPPIAGRLATAIAQIAPPGSRILSPIRLGGLLPVSSIGDSEDRARHERLARKYNVTLPPVAAESVRAAPGGYIIRDFPWVIGGLETVDPDKVKVVLPFAWPLQREEWQLDHLRAQGFTLFVVKNARLFDSPLPAYRDFFRSLRATCTQVARIEGGRIIFGEEDAYLYRCAAMPVNAASTGTSQ